MLAQSGIPDDKGTYDLCHTRYWNEVCVVAKVRSAVEQKYQGDYKIVAWVGEDFDYGRILYIGSLEECEREKNYFYNAYARGDRVYTFSPQKQVPQDES